MAELDDKLKNLLSSPESLSKIISSIREISRETAKPDGQENTPQTDEPAVQASLNIPQQSQTNSTDPVAVPAAGSFPDLSALSKIDPKYMNLAVKVFSEYAYDDDKIKLLYALKPHLRNERQLRIDRAAQMLRLAKSIKAALNNLSGGETLV